MVVRVQVCGVCRTDLHIVEGDIALPKLPLTPGHQVVGVVEETGANVDTRLIGQRVGIPWLFSVCSKCEFCGEGRENLCVNGRFTGYHVDGGYAEYVVAPQESVYPIPEAISSDQAAPLLCAGVIGFRALRQSGIKPGERVGLFGFGASAHVALQVARFWGCEAYVFTRGPAHQQLAEELGADWTGGMSEVPPHRAQRAVVFAPAGEVVHRALMNVERGGTVALAGIHMTPIPELPYSLLYEERTLRSVANSTRDDVRKLLELAARIPVRTEVEIYPLEDANRVLQMLKRSELRASGALRI
jgi:propanol-preferring alcohol dehydrogenase